MKKLIPLLILIMFVYSTSFATIRRIGYTGLPITNVDYTVPDSAVNASSNGDTIMLYPRFSSNWTISHLDKKVVIIGTGYYHYPGANGYANYNPDLQNVQPSSACSFNFYPGSDGAIITGCDIYSIYTFGSVGVNNVKITNCRVNNIFIYQPYTYNSWEISKCEIYGTGVWVFVSMAKVTNLKIFNCICYTNSVSLNSSVATGQTGVIENCIFLLGGNMALNNANFWIQNCIFYSSYPTGYSNCIFNNNVFTTTPSPAVTGTNNIFTASSDALFIAYPTQGTYSNDERFKLKAGSPAIGAGISGVDCGAFGGINPYKLSGIPAIPAIYKLVAPTSAASSNPYTITFSIRANN